MRRTKLALIIDNLFLTISLFAISFVWIRRITKNAFLSLIISISVSLIAFLLFLYFSTKRHSKQNSLFANKKFNDDCLKFLVYCDSKTYINFIEQLLSATHINSYVFKTELFCVYINLKHESTDKDFQKIINITNQIENKNLKIYLITKSTSKSFDELIANSTFAFTPLPISILEKVMETKNFYPINKENNQSTNKKKLISKYKNRISNLSRKEFKNLFFTGISLLFISLITPYSFLYLIIGSLLLFLSIISLIKKNISSPDSAQEFIETIKK